MMLDNHIVVDQQTLAGLCGQYDTDWCSEHNTECLNVSRTFFVAPNLGWVDLETKAE